MAKAEFIMEIISGRHVSSEDIIIWSWLLFVQAAVDIHVQIFISTFPSCFRVPSHESSSKEDTLSMMTSHLMRTSMLKMVLSSE